MGRVYDEPRTRFERVKIFGRVADIEESEAHRPAEGLRSYRHRISVVPPPLGEFAAIAAAFTSYR